MISNYSFHTLITMRGFKRLFSINEIITKVSYNVAPKRSKLSKPQKIIIAGYLIGVSANFLTSNYNDTKKEHTDIKKNFWKSILFPFRWIEQIISKISPSNANQKWICKYDGEYFMPVKAKD